MLDRDTRRRPVSEAQLSRIADAIAPGTKITSVEPLAGGIATATHLLRGPSGVWVLRIYRPKEDHDPVATCGHAYARLASVSAVTSLAPRPVLSDADGDLIGEPILVSTYIEGAPLAPDGSVAWTEQFANALAAIHDAPLDRLAGIPRDKTPRERVDRVAANPPPERDRLWDEALAALHAHAGRVRGNPPTLIHADLWFGNTVWRDGRLAGVIDWDSARIGDPARDVACARADLRLRPGRAHAQLLLERYEAVRGRLHDVAFWDLMADIGPLRWLSHFLEGYGELGAPISMDEGRARAEESVRESIAALR